MNPIEITTHNLHFHDNASIFSIDATDTKIATAGGDKAIRLWNIKTRPRKEKEFCYTTAINSTISLEYVATLVRHPRTVNCIRFSPCKNYLASCCDGGQVGIWELKEEGAEYINVKDIDGDDAYELAWGGNKLFVGFSSGRLILYEISKKEEIQKSKENIKNEEANKKIKILYLPTLNIRLLHSVKAHSDIIQGLSYNPSFNLLTSMSKDRSAKTFLVDKKLTLIEKYDYLFNERMFADEKTKCFFRRLSYSEDGKLLYFCCGIGDIYGKNANLKNKSKHCVYVMHYPFKSDNIIARIGPFDSSPIKILNYNKYLLVFTRRSLYLFKDKEFLVCINNMTFLQITDACIANGVVYVSAGDGFVSSMRASLD
ncbi:Chromatin assembly factor 1 subunit B [Astathelohania contejeani]|uniref:Chromatin assembly factor 1 subunit B n=1 Tax=Astathelohania contejeani TaxID=164912 RepID=A0ABQ7I1P8_9MICR|nr:Chromatin assembly factor 1 subunit B [Thelohania contejeani]